ncbi:MAG: chloride channel protein [Anaerolineaceae bacterium]|nr:chloride channel protein [Anaerolineaceae bacterium]
MDIDEEVEQEPENSLLKRLFQNVANQLINHIHLDGDVFLLITSLVVGISTGLGAVLFRYLIDLVGWVGFTWFPSVTAPFGNAYIILIPALGGLIVGPLTYFFAREAKGHGVPEVMEAVALRGGRIRPIVALVKSLASAITIGSGGSVGREGPIVQIGSAIGSTLGQKLNFSDDRIRNLVACGAAGGIAATFNAPIAGVLFALEIILGEFTVKHFSSVVIAAVASSVIGRAALGNVPAFIIPFKYGVNSLWEFAFYPVLGLAAGIVGLIYIRSLYWSEDMFARLKRIPEWVQPMVGGIMLGLLALAYPLLTGVTWEGTPQIFNVGYEIIEAALANELALVTVLVLLVLKLIATSITLGSGGSGGVFAPSLFMGAMLGTAFELLINRFFPGIAAPPGAYALLGMGALFAATAHAPITAVLILFELTGDYRIILPLMLTVVIATLFAQKILHGESIYTLKLSRRGVRIRQGRDVDVMESVLVQEVMTEEEHNISKSATLRNLAQTFEESMHHGLVVTGDHEKLFGIITITDLKRAISDHVDLDETVVERYATPISQLAVAYPDEHIGDVLKRMSIRGIGRLPVVSRENKRNLLGLIRRENIIRAYHIGLTRRVGIQQRTKQIKMNNESGTDFLDLSLRTGDQAIGCAVQELASLMPKDCVLVSIKRDEQIIIPRGKTILLEGDELRAFIATEHVDQLVSVLKGKLE